MKYLKTFFPEKELDLLKGKGTSEMSTRSVHVTADSITGFGVLNLQFRAEAAVGFSAED